MAIGGRGSSLRSLIPTYENNLVMADVPGDARGRNSGRFIAHVTDSRKFHRFHLWRVVPPIPSRFGNEDGKSDIIRDGWTTEIICRKHTNNPQLRGVIRTPSCKCKRASFFSKISKNLEIHSSRWAARCKF